MRTFVAGASGIGALLVPQLEHGHKVIGTYRSPRTGERVRVLGAELISSASSRRGCGAASRAVPDADRILVPGHALFLGRGMRAQPVAQARLVLRHSRAARQRTAVHRGVSAGRFDRARAHRRRPGSTAAPPAPRSRCSPWPASVIVRRALRAHAALHNAVAGRPWGRILRARSSRPARWSGSRPRLRRRAAPHAGRIPPPRPVGRRAVLLHLHGGRFFSGNKTREARPLIRHLTSRRGFVCVSANYRLQPHVTLADQVADVRDAIAWVRGHAAEFGAEPGTLFVAGSSPART